MNYKAAVSVLAGIGLAQLASAQVNDVSLTFEGDVPDIIDANTGNSLGNESFTDVGGLELLPYARTAEGGFNDIIASASLTAELAADGTFVGSGSNSASDQLLDPGAARSSTTIDFTVTGSLSFEFDYNAFFDNDGGSYSAVLTGPDGTVFASSAFFPGDNQESFSGVIAGGEYSLRVGASSRGNISFNFSFVPAPSGMTLIGLAGLGAARRRRR